MCMRSEASLQPLGSGVDPVKAAKLASCEQEASEDGSDASSRSARRALRLEQSYHARPIPGLAGSH